MDKKAGRPSYEPTDRDREQVKTMSAMGIPDYDIAKVMQMSGPTLRKYFYEELDVGHIQANAQVAQSLFKLATDKDKPNVSAAIFWLKCRARWRENDETVGKKEQADIIAKQKPEGGIWDGLLN